MQQLKQIIVSIDEAKNNCDFLVANALFSWAIWNCDKFPCFNVKVEVGSEEYYDLLVISDGEDLSACIPLPMLTKRALIRVGRFLDVVPYICRLDHNRETLGTRDMLHLFPDIEDWIFSSEISEVLEEEVLEKLLRGYRDRKEGRIIYCDDDSTWDRKSEGVFLWPEDVTVLFSDGEEYNAENTGGRGFVGSPCYLALTRVGYQLETAGSMLASFL